MSRMQQRGNQTVTAGADFMVGVASAFKGLGTRFKRAKTTEFIETFCAVTASVASQNGRLYPEEIRAFETFLLHNRDNSVFALYKTEELVDKMREYAIAEFLCDYETTLRAVKGVEPGSDFAKMVILGSLAIALADGECDAAESAKINEYAESLAVSLPALASEFQVD